jgi:hypothetical protein
MASILWPIKYGTLDFGGIKFGGIAVGGSRILGGIRQPGPWQPLTAGGRGLPMVGSESQLLMATIFGIPKFNTFKQKIVRTSTPV